MVENVEQWEYYAEYIEADAKQHTDFVKPFYPDGSIPKYAIEAAIPRLNSLGHQGWELLQMTPVKMGTNGDVQVHGGDYAVWSDAYLCTFKRRKR
jgi:hypothetical protein